MQQQLLDYRSDTLTRPTEEMRHSMAVAEVGDDVLGEDPTVNRLQERVAELLGKEAALFVPSGTMSNQVAVQVHCQPGDEFICEEGCHIYNYEQGAFAQLGGLVARTLVGDGGVLRPDQFLGTIRSPDAHCTRTRLVCLENTHNRAGGRIQPYDDVEAICHWAHENNLATHLDGARLFNAAVATGIGLAEWAAHFHSVSVCFSKGLGAPVGSALAGSREFIDRAHRKRKCFGGGMRQAGVLAAAALYAIEHHIDRLADDHRHASELAELIDQIPGLKSQPVDTNIIAFDIDPQLGTAAQFVERLKRYNLLMFAIGPARVRAVTHLDLPPDGATEAAKILRHVAAESTAIA